MTLCHYANNVGVRFKIEQSAHPITSSKGGRSVESSLRGPEVRVLIMEASRLNSGPQRGVALDDAQVTPTNAPPPCGGSLGGRASVSNCRERSIKVVALLERRRWRQLAMCPVQADSKTATDRRIVLQKSKSIMVACLCIMKSYILCAYTDG